MLMVVIPQNIYQIMPIDLTHKLIGLSGLEPQSFTDVATMSDFVIFKISCVIATYYHEVLAQNLENSSTPSRNEGFRERNDLDFPQKLNLPIKP